MSSISGPLSLFLFQPASVKVPALSAISLPAVRAALWREDEDWDEDDDPADQYVLCVYIDDTDEEIELGQENGERLIKALIQYHELVRGGPER